MFLRWFVCLNGDVLTGADRVTLSLMRKTCFEFSEVFEFLSFALRIYFSKKGKMQLILFAKKNVTFKRGKILTSNWFVEHS